MAKMKLLAKPEKAREKMTADYATLKARVMEVLGKDGLTQKELARVGDALDNNHLRALVFIQAVMSVLKIIGINGEDLKRLKTLLQTAYTNIATGSGSVFTKEESDQLVEILSRYVSYKTAYRLRREITVRRDEFLVSSLIKLQEDKERENNKRIPKGVRGVSIRKLKT